MATVTENPWLRSLRTNGCSKERGKPKRKCNSQGIFLRFRHLSGLVHECLFALQQVPQGSRSMHQAKAFCIQCRLLTGLTRESPPSRFHRAVWGYGDMAEGLGVEVAGFKDKFQWG